MLDIATLLLFTAACVALTVTPGPDMLLIAARSVSQGRAAGFASLAGIQVGTYCHALAAALGLAEIIARVPSAYDAIRYAGAAYLLYLAWQAFRSDGTFERPLTDAKTYTNSAIFRQGLLTNILNPKMALFVLSLFPQFARLEGDFVVVQFLVLASVLNVIGFIVNGTVIVAASSVSTCIGRGGRWLRAAPVLMGTVFLGLAARLAFDVRR